MVRLAHTYCLNTLLNTRDRKQIMKVLNTDFFHPLLMSNSLVLLHLTLRLLSSGVSTPFLFMGWYRRFWGTGRIFLRTWVSTNKTESFNSQEAFVVVITVVKASEVLSINAHIGQLSCTLVMLFGRTHKAAGDNWLAKLKNKILYSPEYKANILFKYCLLEKRGCLFLGIWE
jgi:hypothetical protein